MIRAGLLAAALSLPAIAGADAQERVRVLGHVLQEGTGFPVEGALVTVEGRPGGAVTDSTGAFRLDSLPAGLLRFRIERLGFWTTVVPTIVTASTSLSFRIHPNPVAAERIEVVIDVLEGRRNAVPYAVRTHGPERLAPHLALDLESYLRRRAGLHLVPCRSGRSIVAGPPGCFSRRGGTVPVRVWIDDTRVFGGLDGTFGYEMNEVHSVEVIPGCGMVRVYTRRFMDAVTAGHRRLYPVLLDCAA